MSIKDSVRQNAGWILTGLSTVGFIGTNYLVAKETPDVMEELEEAGEDATFIEKLKIIAHGYWPAMLTGAGSLGCTWTAQAINAGREAELIKGQAALMAACSTMSIRQKQYRQEVQNEVGEEREKKIWIEANRKTMELQKEISQLKKEAGVQLWAIPSLPGILFEESYGDVCNALMHFNRNMTLRGWGNLTEIYTFLGIPKGMWKTVDPVDMNCAYYGWDTYENEVSWGCTYTDFPFLDAELANGRKVNVISFDIPPYQLGLDYGNGDCSCDHLYGNAVPDNDLFEDYLRGLRDPAIVRAIPQNISY